MTDVISSNLEAYKKEERWAMELGKTIPLLVVEQDLRSKNRFAEHSRPGCALTNMGNVSHRQPNHNLFACACGWTGWLIPKEELDDA